MAVKLFLAALLLVGMMWLLGKIRRVAREKRRRAFRTILLYGAAVALLALAITGKLHWLFAVVGAALPWLNRAMTALQAWRFFSGARKTAGGGAPGKIQGRWTPPRPTKCSAFRRARATAKSLRRTEN